MDRVGGHSVAIAFALTIGAGFATILGGMVVFSKKLVYLANPLSLAMALSVSAGVMIFISLVEIFGKSVELLTKGIKTDTMTQEVAKGHGWLTASGCFGVGIALIYGIDAIVKKIAPETEATDVEHLEVLRESMDQAELESTLEDDDTKSPPRLEIPSSPSVRISVGISSQEASSPSPSFAISVVSSTITIESCTRQRLARMGLITAFALGLHNLPEGIATYVAAVQDPTIGISLAVGIGLHNIPEGIAVAAPIYFSTGSRWKGIMWCAISAGAEPLGGFLAWLAVGNGIRPVPQGILFGVVCGIMVCICVKELWPTAYKFAKGKIHVVALGTFAGMFFMAASLVLFAYAGA